jgi:hypothetical protein
LAIDLEAITVVIRNTAITERICGGHDAVRSLGNATFRFDDDLVGASFQNALDAELFTSGLIKLGLRKTTPRRSPDWTVVDRFEGVLSYCPWLDLLPDDTVALAFMPSLRKPARPETTTPEVVGIRGILWTFWNPLNLSSDVTVETEYDSYIPGLVKLRQTDAARQRSHVERYLCWIEAEWMGQDPMFSRAYEVARQLCR